MKIRYSIRPLLRYENIRTDGKAPIHFRVILNNTLIKLPSGKYLEPEFWDNPKRRVLRSYTLHNELNTLLTIRMDEFQKFMMKQEILGREINREIIKDFFSGRVNMSFYQFWEQQIKSWKSIKREGTLKCYRSTLNSLKEFRSVVQFSDLNLKFLEGLDIYLKTIRKNSAGGAAATHKWTKTMIKTAIRKGYMEKNPYDDFRVKNSEVERAFLTIEEVKTLMKIELTGENKILDKVRDAFIFSCYTGLRYSDIEKLTWKEIETASLNIRMLKTDKAIQVPLIEQSQTILNKYRPITGEQPENKIFTTITNQKTNEYLKRLMKLAKINKPISFHCARHTFASIHVSSGTHMINIKDLLGHSSITQTQVYARSEKRDLVSSMKRMAEL